MGDGDNSPVGTIITYVFLSVVVFVLIALFFRFIGVDALKQGMSSVSSISLTGAIAGAGTGAGAGGQNKMWNYAVPVVFTIFICGYMYQYFYYRFSRGNFRSTPPSVESLLTIRKDNLSRTIGGKPAVDMSVTGALLATPRPAPYNIITGGDSKLAMVNWRPLTVRLTGYLGGINGPMDGVFDMGSGVEHAIRLGARGFVFDIDYLDASPCKPVIAFRDDTGVLRSLNVGSIKDGMTAIANKAFMGDKPNYDPVLIILYLRRIPPGPTQKTRFFNNITKALTPISEYHLGQTQEGNFHNCISESTLFTTSITGFQKKLIVLTNYDTSTLSTQSNPRNNLHWWTNARIYLDPSGKSTGLGTVTTMAPSSPPAYVHAGHIDQLLNVGTGQPTTDYLTSAVSTFKIALGSPDYAYTVAELNKLMNTLGIQCVPIDVLALGASPNHLPSNNTRATRLNQLTNAQSPADQLSFWAFGGWSRKMLPGEKPEGFQDYNKEEQEEGFEGGAPVVPAAPIPGFIIPAPRIPTKPSATMNSAGGKISIG